MTDARAAMLARVRANRPAGDHALPPPLAFDDTRGAALAERFGAALHRMGGTLVAMADEVLPPPVADLLAGASVVWSTVAGLPGTAPPDARAEEAAKVDVAIVPSRCGIAETGSVLLTGADLVVPAVAYLAQHLVVVLDPADLVADLPAAYAHPALRQAGYAVLHTGPSATADIEGVLIHGAQGVRSLTVLLRHPPAPELPSTPEPV